MNFCPHCGGEVNGANFCPHCGANISTFSSNANNATAPSAGPNANAQTDAPRTDTIDSFFNRCLEAFKVCWKKWIDADARASKSEFWLFMLDNLIVTTALGLVSVGTLGFAYGCAMWFPIITASIRRLHDCDYSGWWALFYIIPGGCFVVWILCAALDQTQGDNKYGSLPPNY